MDADKDTDYSISKFISCFLLETFIQRCCLKYAKISMSWSATDIEYVFFPEYAFMIVIK